MLKQPCMIGNRYIYKYLDDDIDTSCYRSSFCLEKHYLIVIPKKKQ